MEMGSPQSFSSSSSRFPFHTFPLLQAGTVACRQWVGLTYEWLTQKTQALFTPRHLAYFFLTQVFFLVAYGYFTSTKLYEDYVSSHDPQQKRPLLFFSAAYGVHTMWLILLMVFNFSSVAFKNFSHYGLLKSLGENVIMLLEHLLIIAFGREHLGLAMAVCGLLTIDTLCVTNLLQPGHRYGLLTTAMGLSAGLGLSGGIYFGVSAAIFIFLILLVANFLEARVRSQ